MKLTTQSKHLRLKLTTAKLNLVINFELYGFYKLFKASSINNIKPQYKLIKNKIQLQ
jgi:hypothetical protein